MSYEKQKTIEGAKWTVIIFSLTTILAFLTNLFLARISPEMVGYFTLMTVFISTITTFVFLGGGLVFPTLLPKIKSNLKKASFVISYFVLVGILMVFAIGIFLLFPSLFDMFLKREVTDSLFYLLLLVTPFVLMMQFSQSLLNGLFEIKLSSIIEKLRTIVLFFSLPIVYLIDSEFFKIYFIEILIVLTILSFTFGFRLSLRKIFEKTSFKKIKLFYFPTGFWSFMLTAQAMSILSYFFNNFDKLIVAQYLGIKELGIYSVIILIWLMTRMIPQLIAKTQIPLMSKYIKEENKNGLENIFNTLNRYTILFSILLGFFLLIFSKEILMIFGSEYAQYSFYLEILVVTSSLLTLSYSVTPMLISLEYNKVRMINSIIQISFQVGFTLYFIDTLCMTAVVLGIALSVFLAQIMPYYIIFNDKKFIFKFPKDYFYGFISTSILYATVYFSELQNIFLKLLLFIIFLAIYLIVINFNKNDIGRIRSLVRKKNA